MSIIGEGSTSILYLEGLKVVKKPNYDLSWCPNEIINDIKSDIEESFQREINFFKSTDEHKHIIKCFEIDEKQNIFLEYAKNNTIYDYLKNNEGKEKWIHQISEALYFIHNNRFAHCDLTTQNILLDNDYNIKICDFGKSRKFEELPIMGSIGYLSPELIRGVSKNPEKCDIYAFGIIIWSIIYRKEPFIQNDDVKEYNNKIVNGWKLPLNNNKYDNIILETWKSEKLRPNIKIINKKLKKINYNI